MSHPCDGHACDHCYICDVEGRCCICNPTPALAQPVPSQPLAEAIRQEASSYKTMASLISLDRLTALVSGIHQTPAIRTLMVDLPHSLPNPDSTSIPQIAHIKENRHV